MSTAFYMILPAVDGEDVFDPIEIGIRTYQHNRPSWAWGYGWNRRRLETALKCFPRAVIKDEYGGEIDDIGKVIEVCVDTFTRTP